MIHEVLVVYAGGVLETKLNALLVAGDDAVIGNKLAYFTLTADHLKWRCAVPLTQTLTARYCR